MKVEFELEIENIASRRQIFAHNLLQIAEHNIDARNGRNTWLQAVNRFTYLVLRSLRARYFSLICVPLVRCRVQGRIHDSTEKKKAS